jgi:hypothetical protein
LRCRPYPRFDMKPLLTAIFALVLTLPLSASERKTIFVDRMDGLEPFVEKALQSAELPFDFVEESKRPELKADLVRTRSAHAELLYKHKLGRNETHRLELRDLERNTVIARHDFELHADDGSRKRAAEEFAAKAKSAWARRSR